MTTTSQSPVTNLPQPLPVHKRGLRLLLWPALSGLLLVGAYPSLDWGWLAWVALVPFLLTFPHRNGRQALAAGLALALVYCGGVSSWVAVFAGHIIGRSLGVVVWLIATATQSATILAFTGVIYFLSRRPNVWAWRLGVPAAWTLGEWLRQFGPFGTGWGDLAYTQHLALVILQVTKLGGVFGLSFLIVLVNIALAEVLRARVRPGAVAPSPPILGEPEETPQPPILGEQENDALPIPAPHDGGGGAFGFPTAVGVTILAALLYGACVLHAENLQPSFVAAALQADVNENVAWTPEYAQRTLGAFGQEAAEASADHAALVVWPETSFPGFLALDPTLRAQAAQIAMQNHEAMLVGSIDRDPAQRKNTNALFLMDPQGALRGVYRKQRLVPFGEYVPFRRWLPFLEKLHLTFQDMEPGGPNQPLMDAGLSVGKIGAAICYESSDSEVTRRQVARGANLLVVSTDDTWFGRTAAPAQHAACSAIRAAENDRYLVRSAATGISQIFTPTGQVVAQAGLFTRQVVEAPVQSRTNKTLYTRWGDWWVGVCALVLLAAFAPWGKRAAGERRV